MKTTRIPLALLIMCITSHFAAAQISVNFSTPAKIGNAGATSELGNGGSYTFSSWVYSNGNGGIDDPGVGLADGSNATNEISSIGLARAQAGRGGNARAASVIFAASNFSPGQQYTVSFQVIGDALGEDTGRYWLAEVSGYDGTSGILIDGTQNGWGAGQKPFTVSGAGGNSLVTYLADSASNGVLIDGENVAGTSLTSFGFTYSAGTDIAFAVGTYNNIFAIDDFKITAVPEPATYALLFGIATLGLCVYRRRQGHL